jgi:hypothetical protein
MGIASFVRYAALCSLLIPAVGRAEDWESLCKSGYAAFIKTTVSGDFKGCEYDLAIKLENGLVFVCRSYSYHYAYHPEVYILKHFRTGDIKVMIDNEEFQGQVFKN